MACSFDNPRFTSSYRLCALYEGGSSGISTLSICIRSFGLTDLRKFTRHSASRPSASSSPRSFISSCSASRYAPIRCNISSKSTSCPSNSGPSMQTNFVLPPTVIRHAPHIPVPSTIIVLSDTSVGIPYFFVRRHTNFIIMAGPMAKHLSTFSLFITLSIPSVTRPLFPYEPSSVIIITSSECSRICSSRIISSFVLPARTEITLLPAFLSASTIGSIGATPTPPPAHTTVPKF